MKEGWWMGVWDLVSHSLKGHGKLEIIHTRSTVAWHTFILWDKTKYPWWSIKGLWCLVWEDHFKSYLRYYWILMKNQWNGYERFHDWLQTSRKPEKDWERNWHRQSLLHQAWNSLPSRSDCQDRASLGMSTPGKEKNNDNGPCMSERGRPGEEEWHRGTVCALQY